MHRDVKPANVMLDGAGSAVLIDLGHACPMGEAAPWAGTAGYLAPEQALGRAVDARTDLYAVGVLGAVLLGAVAAAAHVSACRVRTGGVRYRAIALCEDPDP